MKTNPRVFENLGRSWDSGDESYCHVCTPFGCVASQIITFVVLANQTERCYKKISHGVDTGWTNLSEVP